MLQRLVGWYHPSSIGNTSDSEVIRQNMKRQDMGIEVQQSPNGLIYTKIRGVCVYTDVNVYVYI